MPQTPQQPGGGSQWAEPEHAPPPSAEKSDKESKSGISKKPKLTIFDEFEGLDEKRETKPVVFFFYVQPKDQKDRSKSVLNCQQMGRLLSHPKVSGILNSEFHCYRRNFATTKKAIRKKYKVKTVPMLVFFDATGKVLYRLTSPKTKPERLEAMLKALVKKSDKNLEKLEKKREREQEKEEKK